MLIFNRGLPFAKRFTANGNCPQGPLSQFPTQSTELILFRTPKKGTEQTGTD